MGFIKIGWTKSLAISLSGYKTKFRHNTLKKINKSSFWCVDPKSKFYNSFQTKKNYVCEDLYRDDDLYDIFITFNYNLGNIKKFKGSAIFLHCRDISKDHTDGCIALEKEILLKLLNSIKTYSKLIIL